MQPYPIRVLISLSQLLNTLTGGNVDETTSSRVGRNALVGKRWAIMTEAAINALLGSNHCRRSIEKQFT